MEVKNQCKPEQDIKLNQHVDKNDDIWYLPTIHPTFVYIANVYLVILYKNLMQCHESFILGHGEIKSHEIVDPKLYCVQKSRKIQYMRHIQYMCLIKTLLHESGPIF